MPCALLLVPVYLTPKPVRRNSERTTGESGGTGRGKIVEAAWQDRGAHDVPGSSGTGRCRTTGLTRVDPNRAVSRPNRVFVANCSYLATIERLIQVTSHAKRLAALALDQQAAYDNTTTYQIDEVAKSSGRAHNFPKIHGLLSISSGIYYKN